MNESGYILLFLVVYRFFVREISPQSCHSGKISTQENGKILEKHSFDKLTLIGYKQCADECFVRSDCVSLNYNVIDKTCELNTANQTDVPLSNNANYIYMDRRNIPSSLSGYCSEVNCPPGYKCIPFKSGQTKCISFQLDKPEKCRNTMMGKEYRGKTNVTAMGITCQMWNSTIPHAHSWLSEASNYCRNPDGENYGPWCYTVDPAIRWQYCDIPFCIHKQRECKTTTLGYEYFGLVNTTITGRTYQAWVLNTPHAHSHNFLPGNECRNPDASPNGPWCYTTDNSTRWEYCNVPFC